MPCASASILLFIFLRIVFLSSSILPAFIGLKAIQYRCQIRLYTEDIRFWLGSNGRHNVYDDTIRCDTILSGTRSDSRHGLHGQRGHLVGWLYYGRNDSRWCAIPRHRSHRPMEQNYWWVSFCCTHRKNHWPSIWNAVHPNHLFESNFIWKS